MCPPLPFPVACCCACLHRSSSRHDLADIPLPLFFFCTCRNAANALSDEQSLLSVPVWQNPWLLVAMTLSLSLHALIL